MIKSDLSLVFRQFYKLESQELVCATGGDDNAISLARLSYKLAEDNSLSIEIISVISIPHAHSSCIKGKDRNPSLQSILYREIRSFNLFPPYTNLLFQGIRWILSGRFLLSIGNDQRLHLWIPSAWEKPVATSCLELMSINDLDVDQIEK